MHFYCFNILKKVKLVYRNLLIKMDFKFYFINFYSFFLLYLHYDVLFRDLCSVYSNLKHFKQHLVVQQSSYIRRCLIAFCFVSDYY